MARPRHGVIVEHEEKVKRAEEAHQRKLERNRRWYEANKKKVRLAGGGGDGLPAPAGSGRPVGSLNKRTMNARFVLEDLGVDPAAFLAHAMNDETNPLDVRIECAKSLMPYVFPKLSAVEVSGPDGDAVKVEHEHSLMLRMMGDPLLVHRMEDLVILQAEEERRERGLLPVYRPELPGAEA